MRTVRIYESRNVRGRMLTRVEIVERTAMPAPLARIDEYGEAAYNEAPDAERLVGVKFFDAADGAVLAHYAREGYAVTPITDRPDPWATKRLVATASK